MIVVTGLKTQNPSLIAEMQIRHSGKHAIGTEEQKRKRLETIKEVRYRLEMMEEGILI